jgi:two-component system, OmpR family, phosphate regulon sensor histidine kinase PhoR
MFFNSKVLAFALALFISLCYLMIFLFSDLSSSFVYQSSAILFGIVLVFSFVGLELFVFREIKRIHALMENIKNKEYNIEIRLNQYNNSPLVQIKKEIADFASQKQKEINELKKLETFRREFLADVSHELKTPIFSAQGFVHTLIDGAIDDLEVRDVFLNKAAKSLDGLNVLVEDLITISQLESGDIKMNLQHFDVNKLTEEIFDQLEESAAKRCTKLKFYKYSPKSCYVYADKNRIRQVMTNLVVNAIKYGKDKGTVTVSFAVENEFVFISIKDDGFGIEQPHLNRIFERFYRVEKSRSKDRGGTGLGLAIVKHILEAHQSKIYASSKEGEGTIFSFKLSKGKVINEKG